MGLQCATRSLSRLAPHSRRELELPLPLRARRRAASRSTHQCDLAPRVARRCAAEEFVGLLHLFSGRRLSSARSPDCLPVEEKAALREFEAKHGPLSRERVEAFSAANTAFAKALATLSLTRARARRQSTTGEHRVLLIPESHSAVGNPVLEEHIVRDLTESKLSAPLALQHSRRRSQNALDTPPSEFCTVHFELGRAENPSDEIRFRGGTRENSAALECYPDIALRFARVRATGSDSGARSAGRFAKRRRDAES